MQNVNLLFNKLYYDGICFENSELKVNGIKGKRNSLTQSKFYESDYQRCIIPGVKRLYFKTQYPGLLIGTGYAHGVSSEDDAKLGFSLDYVTGQPYIPGSSVKGMIRSVFENFDVISEIIKDNKENINLDKAKIDSIIDEIFDGNDVFLDAVVYGGNEEGRVLGVDYITPHKNPVKNPVPLQMVKIVPNVTLEFRFVLKEGNNLSVGEKMDVFSQIIEDFGVGAKTNVGYGNLVRIDKPENPNYPICTNDDRKKCFDAIQNNVSNGTAENNGKENGVAKKPTTPQNKGKCRKCGTPTDQNKKGGYFALCRKCSSEAPICSKCNKNKVTWDAKNKKWFDTCYDCK